MMFQAGEKLIYDDTYPVRFEEMARDARNKIVPDLAVVSEDGLHFFARLTQLRRPTMMRAAA